MILHEPQNSAYFKEAIRLTALEFNIPQAYVEKDYFLTLVLKALSQFEDCRHVVFKGGTSLSKIYRAIYRFSEDIDLAILPNDDWSANKVKRFLKRVENHITADFIGSDEKFKNGSQYRKKRIVFPKINQQTNMGEVKDTLLIECNAFTAPTPVELRTTRSMIAQWALKNNKAEIIEQFELQDVAVNVLCWKRTFCEKLLGLMAAAFKRQLPDKVRHFYDIAMLLRQSEIAQFVDADDEFFTMMAIAVSNDIEHANGQNLLWINQDLGMNQPFNEFELCWQMVDKAYHNEFQFMVTRPEHNPTFSEFVKFFGYLKQRLTLYSGSEQHKKCLNGATNNQRGVN